MTEPRLTEIRAREVLDKLVKDMLTHGTGYVRIDPRDFYVPLPWWRRLWFWIRRLVKS
jgi:hypothetical protein